MAVASPKSSPAPTPGVYSFHTNGSKVMTLDRTHVVAFMASDGSEAVRLDLDTGEVTLAPGMETGDAALEFWTDVRRISRTFKGEPCP